MDIKVHQIYFEDWQKAALDPAFVPLDGSRHPFPKLYETYWIVQWYKSGLYRHCDLSGFVSWRFHQKTRLAGRGFTELVEQNPGFDVYFVNPFPQHAYRFFNVWDHGEGRHPGLISLAQRLLDEAGNDISIPQMGRNSHPTLLYCNFWVGNPAFWDAYMAFLLPLYDRVVHRAWENGRNPFFELTTHRRGEYPFFPFLFERLFSTFLLQDVSVAACHYAHTRDEIFEACANPRERLHVERFFRDVDALDRRFSPSDNGKHRDCFEALVGPAAGKAQGRPESSG